MDVTILVNKILNLQILKLVGISLQLNVKIVTDQRYRFFKVQ